MDVEEMIKRYEELKKLGIRSRNGVSETIRQEVRKLMAGRKYMKLRDIVAYFRENNYHEQWGIDRRQVYSKVRMALTAKTAGFAFGIDESGDVVIIDMKQQQGQ